MAILENIRKRTTVLILIIGLALFAFVISGVFSSNDLMGGKMGSAVAEVNGEDISVDQFRRKVDVASRSYGPNFTSTQVVNMVYDQEVRNTILNQQFENLGVDVESDQIIEFVRSSGYAQIPEFQDSNGVFNEGVFKSAIADWRANDPLRYDAWLQDEQAIIQAAKERLYFNLIKGGVGASLAEGKFDYRLVNDQVAIQYVRIPYSSIPDSSVAVSKGEIEKYVKEHSNLFQQDNARDIRFVYFEEKPSVEDENNVRESILALLDDGVEYTAATDTYDTIPGFRNSTDMEAFLERNSDTMFDTIYKAKNELPNVAADSIMALETGEIYGPYRDGDFFRISRMMDKKANGSVKASHILVAWEGAQRANPMVVRTKDEAETRAKELLAQAKGNDVVFSTLARDNSDGPTAPRGGDLGYFQEGVMTDAFNDFCFGNPVGSIGLVETEFGFHIIKIDDKQDVVQVAQLSREVEPSEQTSNTLFTDATSFEMAAIDAEPEDFGDLARERNYLVRPVNKIKEMEESLPGLGSQRSIVQWTFNKDSEVGDIRRFNANNGYVVVQLTRKYKKGLMSPEDASATALPEIRKERKAEQIIKANQGRSMEDLAANHNVAVTPASALTLKAPTLPGAGREPLVVGTAFAMDKDQTSSLIKGESGVYMIKVTGKEPAPVLDNYSTYSNSLGSMAAAQVNGAVYNALKEKAEIEDMRATFY